MIRWGICFSFGLLVLAALAACAGQPAEVQSTSEVVADIVPTLPPTTTPATTSTPQPVATVAPTATPEPTETPEPTAEPTSTPEPTEIAATETPEPTATMAATVGMQNAEGQWWDGEAWQAQQSVGDFVFTGSEFQLKQSDNSSESIVFPVELVTAIQEGRLSLSDFAPITVDNTVYEANDSNGTMWRMMDVVYEGVRHTGAFQEIIGESEIVNVSDETLATSNVETRVYGQTFNVSLTDISDARILEMQKVNYVGTYNGTQKSVPSFYVTFEYFQGGVSRKIRTSSYGGTIWSMGDEKPVSFSMVMDRSRNGSVHIGLSHPVNVPTETWLNGIRGGDDLANPIIIDDLPLALIAMPPENIANNLDSDNPGRVTSIFFR